MIALEVKSVKEFMNRLLGSDAFDSFYLEEATIVTYNTFVIDGHTVPAYFEGTDMHSENISSNKPYSTWKQMRPIVYFLIKGNRPPVSMKLTLHAGTNYTDRLKSRPEAAPHANDVKALAVNIRFENGILKCVTGTSYYTFVMDKTIDNIWDGDFISSMTAMGIQFEM